MLFSVSPAVQIWTKQIRNEHFHFVKTKKDINQIQLTNQTNKQTKKPEINRYQQGTGLNYPLPESHRADSEDNLMEIIFSFHHVFVPGIDLRSLIGSEHLYPKSNSASFLFILLGFILISSLWRKISTSVSLEYGFLNHLFGFAVFRNVL